MILTYFLLPFVQLIGNAYAFEISDINQIMRTKQANSPTATFLHFLIEICETKHPEILKFYEDLIHVDKAKTVNTDHLDKSIRSMKKSLKDIETHLKTHKASNERDRFAAVMNTFLNTAKDKFNVLESMFNKIDRLYKDLGQYFCFDPKKFTLDEFFTEISVFKNDFLATHKSMLQERDRREKERLRKEERDKKEKEIKERNQRNMNLNMNHVNEKGLMDNILQGLQSGNLYTNRMNDNYSRKREAKRCNGKFQRIIT